jgi:DNA-binding transcriptional LysR family regulator
MERRDLEIFLALAERLHFGQTAEHLRVSQARVSQAIQKLERRIGAPLFERTSRRVSLTPIGRRLRDDVQPAYQQLLDGFAKAVAAGREIGGLLRIGFEAPGVADLISELTESFRTRHHDCEIAIREADFADPFRQLRAGEVDALITLLPVSEPDLTTGPVVYTEPMLLAVSSRHPFASKESVTLEDLARDTVLRAARPPKPYWEDPPGPWHTPSGKPIKRGPATATFQELLTVVSAGKGICPLAAHAADYFARQKIAFVPFEGTPPVEWGLVWRSAGETSRVRAFAEACVYWRRAKTSGRGRP